MSPIKKAGRVVKAVATGYSDYAKKHKKINAQASNEVAKKPSGSRALDVQRTAQRTNEMKKQQGVSLRSSIRGKLGL